VLKLQEKFTHLLEISYIIQYYLQPAIHCNSGINESVKCRT